MIKRSYKNITERLFVGKMFLRFKPNIKMSTIKWAETYRVMTSEESYHTGKFDCSKIPALRYVYDCMDNRMIYIIVAMKGSQIGWSELTNNVIGRTIHTAPQKMQWAFPGLVPSQVYSREKLRPFFEGTKVLRDLINVGVAKPSFNYFKFDGGWLKLTTLGAISASKSTSVPFIGVEEPDDVKDDVKGQGNTLENLKGRQKTFPIGFKKLIFGGTPTDKDFSRVEKGYKQSNQMVFKAQCHHCKELIELSLDNLKWDEYPDRFIHELYGKHNPESAYYECPSCLGIWTFEEKNKNILEGMNYGFTDFTGNFSYGWHSNKPEVTEAFGFHIPEILSTLSSSTFVDLAKKKILADIEMAKGDEGLLKSYVNNSEGKPYASGITAMEANDMKKYRSNYPEGIVPMEGLTLTAGIDVQDNRFAYVVRAWGRDNNSWLVKWEEIFGNVTNQDDAIWGILSEKMLQDYPHAGGKSLKIAAISIDSADNTELVYRWVLDMVATNPYVYATRGVRDLRFSTDEIYKQPDTLQVTDHKAAKTLAETLGVTLYNIGAHRAHEEILRRVALNSNPDAKSNVYYFNEQSYGQYEEQMTSCRKIIDVTSSYSKSVFKLISGKRKEAMDAEKMALHASYASGIRLNTPAMWANLEDYLYRDNK